MLKVPTELCTKSNRNICKGKDYAFLLKLSNSETSSPKGRSETRAFWAFSARPQLKAELQWVTREDLEQTRAIRRKARRAGLFPMSGACQGLQSCAVCQSLTGPLLQGLHYMVRQSLESSSAFSSKVSHALLRGHLGWLPSLLVG